MSHWAEIRELARKKHAELSAKAGNDHSPTAILNAADTEAGHQRIPLPAGDPLLYGAEACIYDGFVWFNSELARWQIAFNQAHEYAHYWLHGTTHVCTDCEFDDEASEDESPVGVDRVEGYGPHERRELEANVYAREFLLPADLLKTRFLDEGRSAADIAKETGMPEGMVFHQLSMALFAPDSATATKIPADEPELDKSQKKAACATQCPLLVKAGPGTGKTRTLVGRIVHLLIDQKIQPESILALTYSNKAAEEMRSRVGRVLPQEALRIWMGTFHAFGLETLRKYGSRLKLPAEIKVVDPVDGLYMLETSLDSLDLTHYRDLVEPAKYLPAILSVISRAKDELKTPAHYHEEATLMRARASDAKEIEAAEKALEVARVYAFYQQQLHDDGAVDFGDLISRSVDLLQQQPDVREALSKRYQHIVVDEYQDVNTASRMLLRHLAGDGHGLWVVGDQLQAIYRFRGAAPSNMDAFAQDFPAATEVPLEINYRSREKIVRAFGAFGTTMSAGGRNKFLNWTANQKDGPGEIKYEVGVDELSEADGIADEILRQTANGVPYKHQAILCRTHTGLAKLVAVLERRGIPLFYLGDLFERNEIRDLLSLLSLAAERKGSGLLRVSQFFDYQIAPTDVLKLLTFAREEEAYFPKALELADALDTISTESKDKFARLARALAGISYNTSAWSTLGHFLFSRSDYARNLCAVPGVSGAQQRLAVYQFLQFAHRMRGHRSLRKEDPKRAFLDYVRRLEQYGEEKQLRQPPTWASDIDAVRMLTVHASKGLEFPVVYIPQIAKGRFPLKRQGSACVFPPGLLPTPVQDWHDEEEECLFFVALSRARNTLWLSRAKRYGKQNSNPSDFLHQISARLPRVVDIDATLAAVVPPAQPPVVPAIAGNLRVSSREIETYLKCPKQYYFDRVLVLGGRRTNTGYLQFHHCVYQVLGWINSEQAAGRATDENGALVKLDEVWNNSGPEDHPYHNFYRREANRLVRDAIARVKRAAGQPLDTDWEVPLQHGIITFRPDHIVLVQSPRGVSLTVQRWRTGKPPKKEIDGIYALYARGAELAQPGARVSIEVLYLSSNDIVPIEITTKGMANDLQSYDEALGHILAGEFAPVTSDWNCPRCPHYFICPASEFRQTRLESD